MRSPEMSAEVLDFDLDRFSTAFWSFRFCRKRLVKTPFLTTAMQHKTPKIAKDNHSVTTNMARIAVPQVIASQLNLIR